VNGGNDPSTRCGKYDGQTVSGEDSERRSFLPAAGIDDDTVGLDRTPLAWRTMVKRPRRACRRWHPLDGSYNLDNSRMRLIHPYDVTAQHIRQGCPARTHKLRLIPDMQTHVASERTGARVHHGEVDPGTSP
jgi:hypothetical protein